LSTVSFQVVVLKFVKAAPVGMLAWSSFSNRSGVLTFEG
jgi:hypothetical protein